MSVKHYCILIVSFLVFSLSSITADDASGVRETPKIALVLQGGGALGIAHIAVIKEIEHLGIPIDMVVGTSMGSIIGGLYSAGYSPEEMEDLIRTTDWMELFLPEIPNSKKTIWDRYDESRYISMGFSRKKLDAAKGLLSDKNILLYFDRLTLHYGNNIDFDTLSRKFRAVATDIMTGERVVLSHGCLSDAMRASMGIPGVFAPYAVGNHILVDGGVVDNLPIDVAKELGADYIIAVQLSGGIDYSLEELKSSPLIPLSKTIDLLIEQNVRSQLDKADFLLTIDLSGYQAADFLQGEEILEIGEGVVRDNSERFLSLREEIYQMRADTKGSDSVLVPPPITSLTVRGATKKDGERIEEAFHSFLGHSPDRDVIESVLEELSSGNVYQSIRIGRNSPGEGGDELQLRLEKNQNVNSINLGFSSASTYSDQVGSTEVISGAIIMRGLFIPGSKWTVGFQQNDSPGLYFTFLQPVGPLYLRFLNSISTQADFESLGRLDDSSFKFQKSDTTIMAGLNPLNTVDLSVGFSYDSFSYSEEYNEMIGEDRESKYPVFVSHADLLTLDSFIFPERGVHARVSYLHDLQGYISENSFRVFETEGTLAVPLTSSLSCELEWDGGTDFSDREDGRPAAPVFYRPQLNNRRMFPESLEGQERTGSYTAGISFLCKYRIHRDLKDPLFPLYFLIQGSAGYSMQDFDQVMNGADYLSWNAILGGGVRLSDSLGVMLKTGSSYGFINGQRGFIAIDIGSFGIRD